MAAASWTRRRMLGAMGAALAAPALAETKKTAAAQSPEAMLDAARLTGVTGYCVAEVASGRILESLNPQALVPPASVVKAITALYALERLGAGHQFATRVLATGPVSGGRLDGDLILSGGGDPTLDTDTLAEMAQALARTGLRRISGRFLVYAGALPAFERITEEQPVHVGYDPGLSGLSLNFNRVNFEWTKGGATVQMNARGEKAVPLVQGITVRVVDREAPVFTYSDSAGESWSGARAALAKPGSRWLPVRHVAPYVAEVFANLCASQGITLPAPQMTATLPAGASALLTWPSARLNVILRDMLKYSTNITAETIGLAASQARGLRASAGAMGDWAAATLGQKGRFVDHSGLGAASRVTPEGMMRAIMAGEGRASGAGLRALLKETSLEAAGSGTPVKIRAKSGTLNFVSGLAGFIERPAGGDLAFAIFSADPPRREAVPVAEREGPPGGKAWATRARALQKGLLARWAGMA